MVKGILHIKRILPMIIAGVVSFSSLAIEVNAMTEAETKKFKEEILKASKLLAEAIDSKRQETEKELKQKIVAEGLDYQLTMMSFDNVTDPYKNMDYNEIIFAYATAKEYSNKSDTLYNLPFYTMKVTKTEIEEYLPKYVQTYKETEDGYYELAEKIYIDTPTKVITAKKLPNSDKFAKTGVKTVEPTLKTISYGEVTLSGLNAEKIMEHFDVTDNGLAINAYRKKLTQANSIVSGIGLSQSYNVKVPSFYKVAEDMQQYLTALLENEEIDIKRRLLISVAKALLGKVPYEWGGKSTKSGYDIKWWTLDDLGQQKGLDCSGFVQWAFRTAKFNDWEDLASTQSILKNTKTISKAELQIGDLGLLNNGNAINHVGIYAGDGYWIHCSSGKGTAVIEKTDMFTIFKKMPGADDTSLALTEEQTASTTTEEATLEEILVFTDEGIYDGETVVEALESEIYLLAQLMSHEAIGEGFDGWVAVAEVVRNRILSSDFPDTITEVIYQEGQFAYSDEIDKITPTDELIEVARNVLSGKLEVLGNTNVLYFRNANGSKENWNTLRWFKEINHHEFYLG